VCPLIPEGIFPDVINSDQFKLEVSNTNKSFKCLFPEWPPNTYNLFNKDVLVCAFLAAGGIPFIFQGIHDKV